MMYILNKFVCGCTHPCTDRQFRVQNVERATVLVIIREICGGNHADVFRANWRVVSQRDARQTSEFI